MEKTGESIALAQLAYSTESRDEQTRRIARVLEIIQQIASAPGRWTRRTLAEHHEIGERMIQKDLELIRIRLGLKLTRQGGGYVFQRLPHLPTPTYIFSEALALLVAARAAQVIPGVNSAELAAAIARLESIFPDELRPLLKEAAEKLPLHATGSHRQEMITLLHRALVECRQVSIAYSSSSHSGEVKERIIEPYNIMPYGRSWHLIAYDHQREAVIIFKVDRIHEAHLLETCYTKPADFDLDAYLGDGWGIMRGEARPIEEVRLIFEPQAGRWVAEEQWHKSQQVEILEDGCTRVVFRVGVTPEMVNWILYYGERVQVESPEWLREEVKEKHRRAAEASGSTL
jgi:predicted DNA-binding transcriptional regulator YafY